MARLSIISIALLLFINSCHSNASLHQRPIAFIGRPNDSSAKIAYDVHMHQHIHIIPRGGDITNTTSNTTSTTNLTELSNRLKVAEVQKVKKAQQFLKKQQRRREMDKTWLDKCITGSIEFLENVFRWEVIDVKGRR